jgi:hypothetical protein
MDFHPSSSMETPTTSKPRSLYLRSNSVNQGISMTQGQHNFALEIRQMHHLPVGVFQSEVGRMFALSVFFDRLFDRPAGRACDHTENRGNAQNGKQTQIGSQTFHQLQLYRDYLYRKNPVWKTFAKPGSACPAANRRKGDFRIDPAQYPCGGIAKALATVVAP